MKKKKGLNDQMTLIKIVLTSNRVTPDGWRTDTWAERDRKAKFVAILIFQSTQSILFIAYV